MVAALASFLEARVRGGRWLLRMEDLDTARVVPGAADAILRTLERLGLTWDGAVLHQSQRLPAYAAALETLAARGHLYACDCSRRDVVGPYPGTCRDRRPPTASHALRFRLDDDDLSFDDRWQGRCAFTHAQLGDPVVRRRDGVFAYQLAVVVDDAAQGITDVVRGADLIDSTPWQQSIGAALGVRRPTWAHVPLITEPDGSKLAKSRRSFPVEGLDPADVLLDALALLGQRFPADWRPSSVEEILATAATNWRPASVYHRASIAVSAER